MNIRLAGFVLLLAWFAKPGSEAFGEGFRSGSRGPEASGRGGADLAVAGEASALKSNPAGMAWMLRNRSDITVVGLFDKLDFESGAGKAPHNGDQALFGTSWAYAFTPMKLMTDPFRQWAVVKHEAAECFTKRSRYEGRLEAPVSRSPKKVELRGSGIGFWISDLVLRGRVKGERTRTRFFLPQIEPLPPERPVHECRVEFEFLLKGTKGSRAPSLTLSAYGRNETVLLKGESGEWTGGEISMILGKTRLPPRAGLTAVSEKGSVRLRKIVFLRTFGQGAHRAQTRTPVADEDVKVEVDPGDAKVVLATNAGPFRSTRQEEEIWTLEGADRFKGGVLTSLVLEFRYGFEGGGAKGTVALLVDGKEGAQKTLEPEAAIPPAEEDLERRRRAVDWLEREKVHIGVGVFTDGMMGAGYGNLTSDAGVHEGQLRLGLYSFCMGAAMEVHPALAVGFSFSLVHARFFNFDGLFSQPAASVIMPYESAYLAQTGRDRVSLQVDSNNLFSWGGGGRLGVLARPFEGFSVGAVFRTPVFFGRQGGRAHVDLTDDFLFTGFDTWLKASGTLPLGGNQGFDGEYDAYITGFRMPLRAGVGLAYRIKDRVTVALDGEFIGWSSALKRLTLKFTRGSNADSDTVTGCAFKARLPLGFKDQWTAVLGISADLHPDATLHLGYRWASSPVKATRAHPLFPAHVEHFVSVGVTLRHRNIGFHLSIQHGFDATLSIGRSAHGPLFDGSEFTMREEFAVAGISYEY